MLAESDYLRTFRERRQCFAELLLLSREQLGLIDGDDYPRLLAILGNKQRVIGRLEEIGKSQPRLGQTWQSQRDRLTPAARRACDETLAETESILATLLEQERISTDHLASRREATRQQLECVTAGAQVQEAYRDSLAPVTHRHLDLDQ